MTAELVAQAMEWEPCPFCGTAIEDDDGDTGYPANREYTIWTVLCPRGCSTLVEFEVSTREECRQRWNRRALAAQHAEQAQGAEPVGHVEVAEGGHMIGVLTRRYCLLENDLLYTHAQPPGGTDMSKELARRLRHLMHEAEPFKDGDHGDPCATPLANAIACAKHALDEYAAKDQPK